MPVRPYLKFTPEYRDRVLAAMRDGDLTAHAMALRLGDNGPTARTLEAWVANLGTPEVKEAHSLHRALLITAPVTGKHIEKALHLLRMDTSDAVELLGAQSQSVVDAWIADVLPVPPFVAAHIRTLVRGLDGKSVIAYGGPRLPIERDGGSGMSSE